MVNDVHHLPQSTGTADTEIYLNYLISGASKQLYKTLDVNKARVQFLVDIGSPVSILPVNIARLSGIQSSPCTDVLRSYTGHTVDVHGVATREVREMETDTMCVRRFYIVKKGEAILSMDFVSPIL